MAPLYMRAPSSRAKTILHPTHSNHLLEEVYITTEYICNGCNTLGSGTRYRCSSCDFDLHEQCARCPATLSSFLHPHHALILQNGHVNDRFCDVCGDIVNGLFYSCEACQFDVHPLCTLLPLNAQHALHPQHLLTLQPGNSSWCTVCREVCNFWRYRCGSCCLDIHPECVLGPPSDVPSGSTGQSPATRGALPSQNGGCGVGIPCSVGYPMTPVNQQGFHMGMMSQATMCQGQPGFVMGMNQAFHQGQVGFAMAASHDSKTQGQTGSGKANPSTNEGQARKGKSMKRRIFSVVGRFAINTATTALIGVPIGAFA